MYDFGEKVVITDEKLESYNKIGLFVGLNKNKLAKVYLQEPIIKGKTTVACIYLDLSKIRRIDDEDQKKLKLDFLYKRLEELNEEICAVKNDIYTIEEELFLQ